MKAPGILDAWPDENYKNGDYIDSELALLLIAWERGRLCKLKSLMDHTQDDQLMLANLASWQISHDS